MHVATEGAWTGSYSGATIDGVDMWNAIMTNSTSPKTQIVHFASAHTDNACVQIGMVKLNYLEVLQPVNDPDYVFAGDMHPQQAYFQCADVSSLTGYSFPPSPHPTTGPTGPSGSPIRPPPPTAPYWNETQQSPKVLPDVTDLLHQVF
jgi:hypothetical protein